MTHREEELCGFFQTIVESYQIRSMSMNKNAPKPCCQSLVIIGNCSDLISFVHSDRKDSIAPADDRRAHLPSVAA